MDTQAIGVDPAILEGIIEAVVATAAEKIYQANQGGLAVARAWTYRRPEQVRELGDKAPYYVGWIDPDGARRSKSCGAGADGRRMAGKVKRKVEAELLTGTYQTNAAKTWAEFRKEYMGKVMAGLAFGTQLEVKAALDTFERIIRPGRVSGIKTQTVDSFIAARRDEPSKRRPGEKVSPATVNKELRHLKAALKKAARWGYLQTMPDVSMIRELRKLPGYVSPEDFAKLYDACETAMKPARQGFAPCDWWRGLLVMAYLTGWRISELLALKREDLDLNAGTALTRAEDNKGGRDDRVKLHPVVVEHLRKLAGFSLTVFPWPCSRRLLDKVFHALCRAAGVREYGFHDLRRAFATMNADKLTPDALQALMRHRSYLTTQRYINLARQLDAAVEVLHVPERLRQPG